MDNEKDLKKAELNDEEIEAVSGGSFVSASETNQAKQLAQRAYNKYGEDIGNNVEMILWEMTKSQNSYSVQDFKSRVKKQLGIDI